MVFSEKFQKQANELRAQKAKVKRRAHRGAAIAGSVGNLMASANRKEISY